jgi:hypothetical protein
MCDMKNSKKSKVRKMGICPCKCNHPVLILAFCDDNQFLLDFFWDIFVPIIQAAHCVVSFADINPIRLKKQSFGFFIIFSPPESFN